MRPTLLHFRFFRKRSLTIAKFEPGVYEVVRTFAPAGEPN
jgi:hypothetical protein